MKKSNGMPAAETAAEETPDREYIAGLERGLTVLELFSSRQLQLTPMEAATLSGLPRATARRCLRTLEKMGYVSFDGKRYSMASRVLRLSNAYFETSQLARIVRPVIENVAHQTGESASVAILDESEVVFIARASAREGLNNWISVGVRVSAYNTATGRMLLGRLSTAALDALLAKFPPRALTPKSVVDPKALRKIIERDRKQGYAICGEETRIGSRSIAVPVQTSSGETIAAMALAALSSHMPDDEIAKRFLPALDSGRQMLVGALG